MSGTWRAWFADRELIGCGLLALILIVPGAGWGIPFASSEMVVRGWEVDGIAGIGVLSELHNLTVAAKPDWYVAYPLFHYLVLGTFYAPYLAFCLLTGRLSDPGGAYPYGFSDPVGAIATLVGIGHAVTVVMGCGTVMAVFVLARRLFGRAAAWLCALLVVLIAPFLFHARTGNLDVPVLFWSMMAFVAIERSWTDGATRARVIACGVVAACAVATKDQAYGLLLLPLLMLMAHMVRTTGGSWVERLRWPALLAVSGLVAFVVAGGIVARPDRFVRHLEYITGFEETFANVRHQTDLTALRPATVTGYLRLLGDAVRAIGTAAGWPLFVAGMFGFAVAWRSTPALRWMLAAIVGYFLLVIVPIRHMQYRYAMAPAFLLAIAACALLVRRHHQPRLFMGLSVVLMLSVVPGAAEITHAMIVDARKPASTWLAAHADSGDTVGFVGRPHQLPLIPEGVVVEMLDGDGDILGALTRVQPRWIVVAPDYFADTLRERSVFLPAVIHDGLRDGSLGWDLVARFERRGLLGRPLPYLPYVNPTVQLFERRR